MPDGDIKLTVDLETANAVNSARNLRSVVDNTFAKMSTRKLDDGMKSLVKEIKTASSETLKYENNLINLQQSLERVTAQRRAGTIRGSTDELSELIDLRYKMSAEYEKLAHTVETSVNRINELKSRQYDNPWESKAEQERKRIADQAELAKLEQRTAEARSKMSTMEANGTAYPEVTKDIDQMTISLNNATSKSLLLIEKFNTLSTTATQALDPVKASADRVAQSIGELGKVNVSAPVKAQFSAVGQSAQQADQQVSQLKQDITQPMQQVSAPQVIDLSSINQQLQVIMGQLATLISTTTGQMQSSVQQVATSAKTVGQSIGRETEEGFKRGSSSAMSFDQMVRRLEHSIAPVQKQFDELGSSIRSAGSLIKSKMLVALKKVKSDADNVRKSIGDAFSGKRIKQGLRTLIKYAFGVRSVFFLYRKLRKAVQEGINNLVKFHSQTNATNKQMTEFKTSILYLKNAWASAFAPIINVAMPALTALMDGLAEAGNYIARFIGTLTNQKVVINAVRAGTDDYAKSLDKANKNAKKLNDRLAGFDSLNVLGVDKDTSSGKDDGLPDTNDMFKYVKANDSLADMIRKAWLGDGDFESVGAEIASRFKALLDGIDWDAIQNKAAKFGKVVGTALKGFINDKDMWGSLGTTVAQGLNAVTIAIDEFLQATKGMDWGGGLANMFNAFISNTDWGKISHNIGEAVTQFFTNVSTFLDNVNYGDIAKAVTDFLQGVDWVAVVASLGKFIGSAIKGASNFISAIANGISDALMEMDSQDIEDALNSFIENLDPQGIADALANLLVSAFKLLFAVGKVAFQIMQIMADGIGNWFYDMAEEAGADMSDPGKALVEGLFYGIGKAMMGAGEWVADNIVAPIVNAFCNLLGIHSPSTVFEGFGVNIIQGLFNGLKGAWETIKGIFVGENGLVAKIKKSMNFDALKKTISDAWTNIKNIFTGFWDKIKGVFTGDNSIISKVKKNLNFDSLNKTLTATWNKIKEIFVGDKSPLKKIKDAFSGMGDKIKKAFPDLRSKVTEIWGDAKSGKGIVGKIATAKDKILGFANDIKEKFGGLWDTIKTKMKIPLNGIIGFLNTFINGVVRGFNAIINTLNSFSLKIPDWVPKVGGQTVGFNLKTISAPSIPYLAQGAVIPPNKEFMAILGDQSHGTNIEAPLDTIKQAVAEVIGNNNNEEMVRLLEELIVIVRNKELKVGDKEIGKANERYMANQRMIRGTAI